MRLPWRANGFHGRKTITAVPPRSDRDSISIGKRSSDGSRKSSINATGKPDRPLSFVASLGLLNWTVLLMGSFWIFFALLVLSYMWFADHSSPLWHFVAINGWITTTITLSTLVIRTVIALQAGLMTSMLAGLALEHAQIRRMDLAEVSIARTNNGGPYMLSWYLTRAYQALHKKGYLLLCLTLFAVLTTTLSQFSSTSLTRDLSIGLIPGTAETSLYNTNFAVNLLTFDDEFHNSTYSSHRGNFSPFGPTFIPQIMRPSSWLLKPSTFPAFAEFHNGTDDRTLKSSEMADTGSTLRAFLPVSDALSRQMLRNYTGRATVMDARVVCTRPNFTTPLYSNYPGGGDFEPFESYGFSAQGLGPENEPPRWDGGNSIGATGPSFACAGGGPGTENEWGLSLCQIGGFAGSAISQFYDEAAAKLDIYHQNTSVGVTYLALNISGVFRPPGDPIPWNLTKTILNTHDSNQYDSWEPLGVVPNNEWLDMYFCASRNDSCKLSASICYASLDSAELAINAFKASTEPEPTVSFSQTHHSLQLDAVRQQLGQLKGGAWFEEDTNARGIFELAARDSWIPSTALGDYESPPLLNPNNPEQFQNIYSFLVNAAKMEAQAGTPTSGDVYFLSDPEASWSIPLTSGHTGFDPGALVFGPFQNWITTDATLISLAQEILSNGGDIAHVVQSLLTVMAGSTYYDQLPQLNDESEVATVFAVQALIPSSIRGFLAVVVVTVFHLLLLMLVTVIFLFDGNASNTSQLGNTWRVIAQLVQDRRMLAVLDQAALMTDAQVVALMNAGRKAQIVDDQHVEERKDGGNCNDGSGQMSAEDVVGIRASRGGTSVELVSSVSRRSRRVRSRSFG